jgi:hypothetical protein
MSKYCQFCGKELKKTAKFCQHCGNKIQIDKKTPKATKSPPKSNGQSTQQTSPTPKTPEPAAPQPVTPQQTQPIPPAHQHYQQPPVHQPTSAPMQQKKSNKNLIIGIVVAVVAIVVVLIVVMMFFGGTIMGGDEAKFYGDWEYDVLGLSTADFSFYKNNTYKFISSSGYITETGTWEVKNNKLVIESDMIGPGFMSGNYEYEFSNNDNTLVLSYIGIDVYTLTKK